MKNESYTTTIMVDQSPDQVFKSVNNPHGWWSEEIKGNTDKLNEEFAYHYKDIHRCKLKVVELIPNQKVVWLVLDNHFNFTKDKTEWKGTRMIFEIAANGERTQLRFTHDGLVPAYECYEICNEAWTNYINESLCGLITKGKGTPIMTNDGNEFQSAVEQKL